MLNLSFERLERVTSESGVSVVEDVAYEIVRKLGISPLVSFSFPDSERVYTVRYDRIWKLLHRGLADWITMKYVSSVVSGERIGTIFDIGAHVGTYSLYFSELCNSVVAFEPDPVAMGGLMENLRINRIENVNPEPMCVSDRDGFVEFVSDQWGRAASSIRGVHSDLSGISVQSTSMDSYCSRRSIRPEGVKLDVEGAEGLVMDGWRSRNNCWLLVDFHGHLMNERTRKDNFGKIMSGAIDARFICSYLGTLPLTEHLGEKISKLPPTNYFTMFVQY